MTKAEMNIIAALRAIERTGSVIVDIVASGCSPAIDLLEEYRKRQQDLAAAEAILSAEFDARLVALGLAPEVSA